jgi:hypothetical protein
LSAHAQAVSARQLRPILDVRGLSRYCSAEPDQCERPLFALEFPVKRREVDRRPIPRLSHDEAVGHLLEYTFGRLSPRMNAAVEAHVRGCVICQRQGLSHAATEKRVMDRRLRRIKPGRSRGLSRRARALILVLVVIIVLQLLVIEGLRGALPFKLPFSNGGAAPAMLQHMEQLSAVSGRARGGQE